jgi:hypothetical protein
MEAKIYAAEHRARLLAACIPALSLAAGKDAIARLDANGNRNFDMQALYQNGWPASRQSYENHIQPWYHNDIREVAYFFVHKLFDFMTQTGELR